MLKRLKVMMGAGCVRQTAGRMAEDPERGVTWAISGLGGYASTLSRACELGG